MDNKLVFEPTTLTQYNWRKYRVLSQYTYYWRVYSAIAEYLYTYYWKKNEVISNGYLWDKYSVNNKEYNLYKYGLYTYSDDLDGLVVVPQTNQRYGGSAIYNTQTAEEFGIGYITYQDFYNIFNEWPLGNRIPVGCYTTAPIKVEVDVIRGSGASRYSYQWITQLYFHEMPEVVALHGNAAQTITYNGIEMYFKITDTTASLRIINKQLIPQFTLEKTSDWGKSFNYDGVIVYEGEPYYCHLDDFNPSGTTIIPEKGTFIEEVISSNRNRFTDSGIQDGYWYEYYGGINTHYNYIYQRPLRYTVYQGYWVAYYPAKDSTTNALCIYRYYYGNDYNAPKNWKGGQFYTPGYWGGYFNVAYDERDLWFNVLKSKGLISDDDITVEENGTETITTGPSILPAGVRIGRFWGIPCGYMDGEGEGHPLGSQLYIEIPYYDTDYQEWKVRTEGVNPNPDRDRYLVYDIDGWDRLDTYAEPEWEDLYVYGKLRFAIPSSVNVKTLPFKPKQYKETLNYATHSSVGKYIKSVDLSNSLFYDGNCLYDGVEFNSLLRQIGGVNLSKIFPFDGYGPNYFVSRTYHSFEDEWWVKDYVRYGSSPIIHSSLPYLFGLYPTNEEYSDDKVETIISYKGPNDEELINAGYTYSTMEESDTPYVLNYIETVNSNNYNDYPIDGLHSDGYYYILDRTEQTIIGYHKGDYVDTVNSLNISSYPESGEYNGLYYQFYETAPYYSKGAYITNISSFIETAYPLNGYIINDAWYEYIGSQQITVNQLEIDKSLLMGGVNYTQEINPSEDLMIGTPGAAQIDFTIFAPDASAATQYLGKDFVYYVKMNSDADWRQIGTFTLTKAELPDKQTAKIQGFDYIYKFDTIIDEWLDEQTFPMTLGDMFASLCEYVGCEAYSTDFTNSDFQVNDNFEAVQITGRTILQYITEASGGFCVAEPDGRIHLKHYAIPPTGAVNLGNNSYRKYTHEIYNVPVISSVVVRKDDDDEGVESNV